MYQIAGNIKLEVAIEIDMMENLIYDINVIRYVKYF